MASDEFWIVLDIRIDKQSVASCRIKVDRIRMAVVFILVYLYKLSISFELIYKRTLND